MTNVKVERKTVISSSEFREMLDTADSFEYSVLDYYRIRDKALICIFKKTGKRRGELPRLEIDDLEIKGENLSITFSVQKKRNKNVMTTRREKQIPLSDPLAQPIIFYWEYMKEKYPDCKWLFPRTFFSPLTDPPSMKIGTTPLTGRQLLRHVKKLNPDAWCHLVRETMGAEIVRGDPSIMAPFKVMMRLDLESYSTAFNYMKRYAVDVISSEEET